MTSIALIRNLALQRHLDPAAVLAVANSEGLSGGIGDGGHAFGPWQLNNAGGVLTGQFRGLSPQAINKWAWSPAGITYALNRIAPVAQGLRGSQAISAIVNRFERPAAPVPEIARSNAAYSRFSGGGGAQPRQVAQPQGSPLPVPQPGVGSTPQAPAANPRAGLLNAIITGLQQGKDVYSLLPQTLASNPVRPQMPPQRPVSSPKPPVATLPYRPGVTPSPGVRNLPVASGTPMQFAELLHEGVGGPTHSTGEHIHVASTDPNTMLRAISLAESMGLSARENPYVDPVDPVHATNSYHYRTFPGLYHGKHLGEAVDVSGPNMLAFYNKLAAMRG